MPSVAGSLRSCFTGSPEALVQYYEHKGRYQLGPFLLHPFVPQRRLKVGERLLAAAGERTVLRGYAPLPVLQRAPPRSFGGHIWR
jgi:hypothetical protein